MNAQVAPDLSPIGLPAGLHYDVPAEVYHQRLLGVVSNSALKEFARSPRHYRAWVDGLDKESPALDFGRAFHCALLEPARYPIDFPVMPEFSGKGSVAMREAWFESQPKDAQPIMQDAAEKIAAMLRSVYEHPIAGRIVVDGQAEVTAVWRDSETGLWCKSRADYYQPARRFLLDVKTCRDASPDGFARAIADYRYHVQQAMYVEAWQECDTPIQHYVILAIESEPPHCCATYTIDVAAESRGFELLYREREALAQCLAAAAADNAYRWPAYTDKTLRLSLPRWALTD